MTKGSDDQTARLDEVARRLAVLAPDKQRSFLRQLDERGLNVASLPIVRLGRSRAPLSFAQSRFWFLWRMSPASAAYNMPAALRLRGVLDHDALQGAVDGLVRRHEALRTVFSQGDGTPEQIIQPPQPVTIHRIVLDGPDRERRAVALAREQALAPFDLEAGPLLRIALLEVAAEDHVLVVTMHHIASDGWSMSVLVDEFWQLYAAASQGRAADLPEAVIQYADYAAWQRLYLLSQEGQRQLDYWTGKLGDEAEPLQLPFDRVRLPEPDFHGANLPLTLYAEFVDPLRNLARSGGTTLFAVLLTAFTALLQRYSGQTDIRVGVPVANRSRGETPGLIGPLVNTIVVRSEIGRDDRASDLLLRVHRTTLEAQSHQDLPFERLVEALHPQRSLSEHPLFQVLFNFQQPQGLQVAPEGLGVERFPLEFEPAKFDLALDVLAEKDGSLSVLFSYATSLFDAATIARLAAHWVEILRAFAADPTRRLDEITLEDRTSAAAPAADPARSDLPVHLAFLHQAGLRPDAEAVICGAECLSYGELAARAARLARRLADRGVGPGAIVGIALPRTPALVAALLATLEIGATYVPLDPATPPQRLAEALVDAETVLLLTDSSTIAGLSDLGCDAVAIDALERSPEIASPEHDAPDKAALPVAVHSETLAYVIYTSGSTGKPKGVAVAHGPFAMHCKATAKLYDMRPESRELLFLSFAFDGAHERLWTALSIGACVVLRDDALWSPERTLAVLAEARCTHAGFPPAYLQELAAFAAWRGGAPQMQVYSFGGEAMPRAGLAEVVRSLPTRTLINGYGPTEAVVTPLVWKAASDSAAADFPGAFAPIGSPVGDRWARVLDAGCHEVPGGVVGELFVGGYGLARGYLGRAASTAERFVPDPFGVPGSRMYRTGDLASRRTDGSILYRGRGDDQLKIRGHRIEPGEVEARLLESAGVARAAVVARPGAAGLRLVGYAVPAAGAALDGAELHAELARILPDWMVPAQIIVLERLPVTPTGKLDRRALPEPDVFADVAIHEPPTTPSEIALAAIWEQVLGLKQVGRNDDFFELGGDSIVSLQVVSRARRANLLIEPRDVFRHRSLAALAAAARPVSDGRIERSAREVETGPIPLLPIQAAFFAPTLDGADAWRHHWNQAVLLDPYGLPDWPIVAQALDALVAHHAALRLCFRRVEESVGWVAEPEPGTDPERLWLRRASDAAEVTALCAQAQASLDIGSGQLMRGLGVDLADGSRRLLLAIHHLVVDGVSWRVLLEDLARACGQLARGEAISLPGGQRDNGASVAAWARRLAACTATQALAAELPHWLSRGDAAAARLPCDREPARSETAGEAAEEILVLDAGATSALLGRAPSAYRTQANDLLLAALLRAVSRWRSAFPGDWSDSLLLELEGHGREDLADAEAELAGTGTALAPLDVSRTVGWFTSAFPVLLMGGDLDDAALIKTVKEALRAIPRRGLGYGMLARLGPATARAALAARPQPQLTFNYLGRLDTGLDTGAGEGAPFAIAREGAGPGMAASAPLGRWLNVNAAVREGCLRVSFGYGRGRYDAASVGRLAALYEGAVRELTAHCLSGASGLTPSDVPLAGLDQAGLDDLGLDWAQVEDLYPLTAMQQGLLFHALEAGEQGRYVNQMSATAWGLDADRLRVAWEATSARHAVLRTGVRRHDGSGSVSGGALQVVIRRVALPFTVEDWRGTAAEADRLAALAAAERARGFDLERAPLQRVRLIRLADAPDGESRHRLIWTTHHLALDGWSSARFLSEVVAHYRGAPATGAAGLYRDYVGWLAARQARGDETFWRETLSALDGPTLLAEALEAAENTDEAGSGATRELVHDLEAGVAIRAQSFVRARGLTLNSLVQGACALLLACFTGRDTICFGATVSERPTDLARAEETLGLFINTLPVVLKVQPDLGVADWLRTIQETNLSLREHAHVPLARLQRLAGRPGQALFDMLLVFENYPVDAALRGAGDAPRFADVTVSESANYPLMVSVAAGAGLRLHLQAHAKVYGPRRLALVAETLTHLIAALVDAPDVPVGRIPTADIVVPIPPRELTQDRADEPVHVTFARRARLQPLADALICDGERLTYGDLAARVTRLARALADRGVGPGALVGIALPRTPALIVALLATLETGAAYLPLDTAYPPERLAHMVADAGPALVLVQDGEIAEDEALAPEFRAALTAAGTALQVLDSGGAPIDPSTRAACNANLVGTAHTDSADESLAYVIYTSGSTGTPKGVMVPHRALSNVLGSMAAVPGLAASDTVLALTSLSFDIAVLELLLPLTVGARIVLATRAAARDPQALTALATGHDVSVIQATPSTWRLLAAADGLRGLPRACGRWSGGEALPADLARLLAGDAEAHAYNLYGPTETTVWSACAPLGFGDAVAAPEPPLGAPVRATSLHVLDTGLHHVAAGARGELFIGGAGLARGYLGRPALTAERFVPDPFDAPGARMYRTGDLVGRHSDGAILYRGRSDDQMKIRGHRIEPGEIEARLLALDGVAAAAVVARPGPTGLRLIGYAVLHPAERPPNGVALCETLAQLLPGPMVPAQVIVLDRLPLTHNGKLDRRALPEPDAATDRPRTPPRTSNEIALAGIWKDILRLEAVGADDDFFELGGDSIVSLQVVSRARRAGLLIAPRDVFRHRRLAALAAAGRPTVAAPPTDRGEPEIAGPVPLLPIQAAFFASAPDSDAWRDPWNQAALLDSRGLPDWPIVAQALDALVARHPALRLRFRRTDDDWVAEPTSGQDNARLWLRQAATPTDITALCAQAQASLDIDSGHLVRGLGVDLDDGSRRLALVVHHLVVDGVSWRVLLEDLAQACEQLARGEAIALAGSGASVLGWARRLVDCAKTRALEAELPHWLSRGDAAAARLPRDDDSAPGGTAVDTAAEVVVLDAEATANLLTKAASAYRTQANDLLLAALLRAVMHWRAGHAGAWSDTLLLELEGHGREDLADAEAELSGTGATLSPLDVSRTVGWLTSAFPVLLAGGSLDDAGLIKGVKEALRAIPRRGLGYGMLARLGSAATRAALAARPQPQLGFSYQGRIDAGRKAFALAPEAAGPTRAAPAPLRRTLSVNAAVREDRLHVSFDYDRGRWEAANVAHLATLYGQALRELTAHCLGGASGLYPSDVPLAGLDQAGLDALGLDWAQVEDLYPLTAMQQGLLFHALQSGEQGLYVNQLSVTASGLDGARLRAAWEAVSARHAVLRTSVLRHGVPAGVPGGALQVVHRRVALPFVDEDWRGSDAPETERLQELAAAERDRGFDLARAPLQRVRLVRLADAPDGDSRHRLIWTSHHLILDGWSSARFLSEVMAHYRGAPAIGVAGLYRDYVGWLAARQARGKEAEAFWRDTLSALDGPTLLAEVFAPESHDAGPSAPTELIVELGTDAVARAQSFARTQGLTLNTLVQGACALLLARFTGRDTICFGTTVSERPADLAGAEETLGLFISTLPVVVEVRSELAVADWLRTLQDANLVIREHGQIPLARLQRLAGHPGRAPFDTLLVFENYPIDSALRGGEGGPRFGDVEGVETANYPLTVSVTTGASLRLHLQADAEIYGQRRLTLVANTLVRLIEALADAPDTCVGRIATGATGREIGAGPRRPDLLAPSVAVTYEPVHAAFERQARRQPLAEALVCGDEVLTYADLSARAGRMARALAARGIRPGDIVGIALPRCPALIVTLIATLRTGAAYLPLDPALPTARLAGMLADAGCAALVVDSATLAGLPDPGCPILTLDTLDQVPELDLPDRQLHPQTLAYVIYTSGSTGKPKGVAVAHGPLAMHIRAMAELTETTAASRELLFLSLAFDGGHERLWIALTVGARIVLRDDVVWSPERTLATLGEQRCTNAEFPPAYLQELAAFAALHGHAPEMRLISFGGEAMPQASLAQVVRSLAARTLVNAYGPTETIMSPLAWKIASDSSALDFAGAAAPIGQPVGDRSARVLDSDLHVVPDGVVRELFVGGTGMAWGYLGRPGLTAERFLPDPHGAPGGRMYRTGDLACRQADGTLLYRGRADDQVKIRGHRIEPSEVEAHLLALDGIAAAAVVARPGPTGLRLIGYAAPTPGVAAPPTSDSLRESLARTLPAPMVPARVILLDRLPTTPNGKIDRRALPEPDAASEAPIALPRTPAEIALADIWRRVLQLPAVGLDDDFFNLGGDSISALQVETHARAAGWLIRARDLLRQPRLDVLAAMAQPLTRQDSERADPLPRPSRADIEALGLDAAAIDDVYPLSPMQEGMLFHALREAGDGDDYVNQICVTVHGLDGARFRAAWEALGDRHAILRTSFVWGTGDDKTRQVVHRRVPLPFIEEDRRRDDCDAERLADIAAEDHSRGFDLSTPPLHRIRLIRLPDAPGGAPRHRLIWTLHHILLDGWSVAHLVSELMLHYRGQPLGPPPPPYRNQIAWLAERNMAAAEPFWRDRLATLDAPTRLAEVFGGVRGARAGHGRIYTTFDEARTGALKAFARAQRITLNTLVQAAWTLLLQRYTGQDTVCFGATVSGRPAELPGSHEMVGLFINTLPIVERRPSDMRVGDWLRGIQNRNVELREHEQTSLALIQAWAGKPGQALFDSIVVFENYPLQRSLHEQDGLVFSDHDAIDVTNYAMDLSVTAGETLRIEYLYLRKPFSDAEAERIRETLEHLLVEITRDASKLVGQLDLATLADKRLAKACNDHAAPCPELPFVHTAITGKAADRPEAVALVIGERQITYSALEARANRLAHHLIREGIGPEDRVGVLAVREIDTFVAMLAVLKAGAAYVPLDPRNPTARLAYMIEDAGIRLVLSDGGETPSLTVPVLRFATLDLEAEAATPPASTPNPQSLAYVIYTSGSTGQPKGVAVTHGPLSMHCRATAVLYEIDQDSCELHVLSLAFDGAHERWLTVLTHGARLVVTDAALWAPQQIVETLYAQKVTHLGMPPAYLRQLADWVETTGRAPPVKLYSFGGEAMPKAGFEHVAAALRPKILINGYGPTETVVTPLVWKVAASSQCEAAYAPIGVPVGDRTATILDAGLDIAARGIVGELCIGGTGLARGYYGRPGATAERFVPDPYGAAGARMYRTGDLARWDEAGIVEYLGRLDDQVKIRGFRIELGEIEARLRGQPGVREAVVVAQEAPAGSRLVAYVAVGETADAKALTETILVGLKTSLPDYMVPAQVVALARLPLTATGKVERSKLPAPAWRTATHVAPITEAETALVRIWQEVLKVERVGVTDDFFELGGNSLLSLQVVSRLRREGLGLDIKLRDLMRNSTIAGLLEATSDAATVASKRAGSPA